MRSLVLALLLSTTASASHHQHRHHKGHHHHHHAVAPSYISYGHKPNFDQFIGLSSSEYQKVQSIVDEKGILEKV